MSNVTTHGNLYTVAAPSGGGKTSLVKALVERLDNISVSVSHTTRPIRPGETNGQNYHFVSKEEFEALVAQDAFLEHAFAFEHYYGTSKSWVLDTLQRGQDVILEIEWQGARQVRQAHPESIGIFILPPSKQTLLQRLKKRAQDDDAVIQKRMAKAKDEISHYHEFDYLVINDDFETALEELMVIVRSQRLTQKSQLITHQALIQELLS